MNFLVKLGDKIINHGLRTEIPRLNCVLEVGQKRTGKSSLFVPVADYFRSIDYKVFCNFPIQDCYAIPLIKKYNKKAGTKIIILLVTTVATEPNISQIEPITVPILVNTSLNVIARSINIPPF